MSVKVLNWNVNGFRSILQKGFADIIAREKPEVFCLQEVKCNDVQVFEEAIKPLGYEYYVNAAIKPGYSGVLTAWRSDSPYDISVVDYQELSTEKLPDLFDTEGRIVVLKINDLSVMNLYVPSGSSGEQRQEVKYTAMYALYNYLKAFSPEVFSNIIMCGDFNICHEELDIHHPAVATKKELSGFLPPERAWFTKFLGLGLTDVFRSLNPEVREYTWWSFRANSRAKNLGWRIDYYLVGSKVAPRVTSMKQCTDIIGSDHCPLLLEVR